MPYSDLSFAYQIHIITGMIAFFVGPTQFISSFRSKYLQLHRLFGRTYIICVLISSVTGLVISFNSSLVWAVIGTAIQSVLWFAFTWLAYLHIRKKEIAPHRRWMIRSYALVLAAPVVRVGIIVLEQVFRINYMGGFDFYYPFLVWVSFLPLIVAEVYVRTKGEHVA